MEATSKITKVHFLKSAKRKKACGNTKPSILGLWNPGIMVTGPACYLHVISHLLRRGSCPVRILHIKECK